ncbi:aromatic-ring-hydroxylating dioxygenase subunit beta [Streptomyces sp. NBC_01373]|uniref:aromatic-ring-hydroxylating dioxygenase subunit beta n=1 Tax=Streptomyces sp. NBC_01373 TaxID=2903843 RepID=UPI00225768D1|nr:aromatic-ring-hydroxylating dioxygenase subunit beta [Streptomyces sp. NBC_01373]MCX4703177.1 nuclear transport factor 2 family protein [Streptomyces sp. NBC_01373]
MLTEQALLGLTDARVSAAVQLVWREARLLDGKRYEEWDRLWAPDSHYVIPIDPETEDFEAGLNMVYDDDRMRRMRIERLVSGYSISVAAAARTVRTVSSFVVLRSQDEAIELSSAQVLVGHRREETFVLGADLTHRIVFDGGEPRIARKVIRLLNSQEAVSATGFLL